MCVICAATQNFDPSRHAAGTSLDFAAMPVASPESPGTTTGTVQGAVTSGSSWGATPSTLGDWGGVVTWSFGPSGQPIDLFPNTSGSSVTPSYGFDHEALVRAAFDAWSTYGNVEFIQVEDPGTTGPGTIRDPDIRIFFGEISGSTLGWAYFPNTFGSAVAGDILLQSQLPSYLTSNGFFILALHEIGHALGLEHASGNVVMNGTINQNLGGLQADDIDGIRQVYGTQDNAPTTYTMDSGRIDLNILDAPENLSVQGNALDNEIDGTDSAEQVFSAEGHDTLFGRGGDDTLISGTGNDEIQGGTGHDLALGNEGDDTIAGGDGNDTIRGGNDFDVIFGNSGSDEISGQRHGDTILGGQGDDRVNGGGGDDMLYGDEGNDFVKGGARRDHLEGGAGHDTLAGNWLADTLLGGAGDDRLFGGNQDDRLNGGTGNDFMNGGSGRDVFVFFPGHDADRIVGFNAADDRLEIANPLTGGVFDTGQVVDLFADVRTAGIFLDFGGGDTILLAGVTSLSGLSDAIDIV